VFDFEKVFTAETKRVMKNVIHYLLEGIKLAEDMKMSVNISRNELLSIF
jgi:hypothetical protein